MKPKNIQQEILVVIQTSIVQLMLIEKNGLNGRAYPAEALEKAIWHGMLNEMLPELMFPMKRRRPAISIWQISIGESSLLIDMAETPEIAEDTNSINPYLFLLIPRMN